MKYSVGKPYVFQEDSTYFHKDHMAQDPIKGNLYDPYDTKRAAANLARFKSH